MKQKNLLIKLLVTFSIIFVVLFVGGHLSQNSENSSDNCQGFSLFGCATSYDEHSEKTGHGFPFNDLFIHSSHTINGKTSTAYKTVDWHNLYQDLIIDAVIAALLALPAFLAAKLAFKTYIKATKSTSSNKK